MNQKIEHFYLSIRGLKLHIARIGKVSLLPDLNRHQTSTSFLLSLFRKNTAACFGVTGEIGTLLFVHGFPEVWYSWRHQMVAAAAAGLCAIAPDLPGYGLSEPSSDLAKVSWEGLMNDLLAILDSLSILKVFLVAKDFGVKPAFDLALCHPDRVCGIVTCGVPPIVESLDFSVLPEGFYAYRWREPGRAEVDFSRFDVRRIMRAIYILFSKSEIPVAKQGEEIMDLADESTPMPQWFTEEDLSAYTVLYEKTGFVTALQIPYRTKVTKIECANPRFEMPMLVIMGQKDYFLNFPAMKEYMSSEKLKEIAPDHDIAYIPEGSHFVQEQFPDLVNQLVIDFIKKHV